MTAIQPNAYSPQSEQSRSQRAPLQPLLATGLRPWSALVCGLPEDGTMLIVDWLILACREAGYVAHATPIEVHRDNPHGMYIEVAGDRETERELGSTTWGAVDLVVAGEHLELARAITAGFVDPDSTTIISSCRRSYTQVEQVVAPQFVLAEQEIDTHAMASSRAYHGFDGHEVLRWYSLPTKAQPGLLFGALAGSGATGLDEDSCQAAIARLGIDSALNLDAFKRGIRLGRRTGGRIRRPKTAYQFTRKRRAVIPYASRREFEALIERCDEVVDAAHVPIFQHAIFAACEFQDAAWATRLFETVARIARVEREQLGERFSAQDSIIPDVIRSLVALMVWPDLSWVANRKLQSERFKQLRSFSSLTRSDSYDLDEFLSMDAEDRFDATPSRLRSFANKPNVASLLQSVTVSPVRSTTLRGAWKLRRLARAAAKRPQTERFAREVETLETWLQTLDDALSYDHELARIVAQSGTLIQGSNAVRDAHRQTALAFWGRVVRQSIALDRRENPSAKQGIASHVVPFVWEQLCRSGPLALWEYAAQVLGIALARSRGLDHAQAVELAAEICNARRPIIRAT